MSYEMSFEMFVGVKEQRAEVLAVAKKALIRKGYREFADRLIADKTDCKLIRDSLGSFLGDNFDKVVSMIYEAVAIELPDVDFKGFSCYAWGTYEAGHSFEKVGNILKVNKLGCEGAGTCPECGEEVIDVDNFDPTKTYTCPECGEEISASGLFDGFYKEDKTFEIVDRKLIEK